MKAGRRGRDVGLMFDRSQLILFVGATLALIAVPGPAVTFIVARSVSEGLGVGVRTAAGVAVGNLSHALAAAFGLAAVLLAYPVAYQVIRYAGAGYLVYLGVRALGAREGGEARSEKKATEERSVFLQGMFVGMLNPKVALFLLAFLPQFTSPEAGQVWLQLLILGVGFVLMGWAGDTLWAVSSGIVGKWIRKGGAGKWGRYASGGVYIALGIATVVWFG